ncbi:MAG: response regulator [Sphingobacteriales bacterium]|jgi:DNA-binding response OmpR family regulator|nr:response regulator [Sphingobacteriales bacterium]
MTIAKKILIVDDDPNILLSVEFLLVKNGFDVIVARNGMEAIEAIEESVPDVVLLDIMMPDVDGYVICEFIKKNERTRNAKVIFLSAKSREADISFGYEMGADLYMIKPFSTRTLLEQINILLS